MKVVYARAALRELDDIWDWNAERHRAAHADAYIAFLREGIGRLASGQLDGKPVEGFAELRRATFRRRPRGAGHVVIYEVSLETLDVLHVYHTKQDIESRLADERG